MSTEFRPPDDQARELLTERIDSYDVDDTLSIWERLMRWLSENLSLNVDAAGTGNVLITVLLVLAVVVLVWLLFRYFRPSARPDATVDDAQLIDPSIAAAQYFNAAQQYLAAGQLDQAYIHAYRSIVRDAQQRQLVEVTPATTATVFGWSLGAVLPDHREAIDDASGEFNRVVYGDSTPTRTQVDNIIGLAQTVSSAQPQAYDPHNDPARLLPR